MSWTEVHDEAEALEHAVSDRLIDRIDEMLGQARSRSPRRSDSERRGARAPAVLRNAAHLPAERAGPREPRQRSGPRVPALRRAPRSEARRNRQRRPSATRRPTACASRERGEFTIGARAASKVLVQAVAALLLVLSIAARRPGAAAGWRRGNRQRAIQDHGQLVPRRRSVQPGGRDLSEHLRRRAIGRRLGVDVHAGMAGRHAEAPVLVHARLEQRRRRCGIRQHADQLPLPVLDEGPGRPAFSPRLSLILPTGDSDELDSTGLQFNLPFSKQTRRRLLALERRHDLAAGALPSEGGDRDIESPFLAGSAIVPPAPDAPRDAGDGGQLRRAADSGRHGRATSRSRCPRDCAAAGTSATSS